MKRLHVIGFMGLLAFTWVGRAQESHFFPLYRAVENPILLRTDTVGSSLHPGVRPLARRSVSGDTYVQSMYESDLSLDRFVPEFYINKTSENSARVRVYPLFSLVPGFESGDTEDGFLESSIGAHASVTVGKQWDLQVNFLRSNSAFPIYIDRYIINNEVVPGQGYAYGTDLGYHYRNSNGYLSYRPGKHFTLQLGHGKNQFGEGYRSVFLSDFADNYDYFKITTDFWKIKYVNLWARFKDISLSANPPGDFEEKYGAFHYLSWNVTRRWNIQLFEGVIWQGQDSLVDRGFDYHYLNPIILYRPVEFSIGSPDNMLVGIGSSVFLTKTVKAYGQLTFDEFVISELRDNRGWWGNKYAAQLGMKYRHAFGVEGLGLHGEFNYVRPYTYAHANPLQAFAHQNEPLAMPRGANLWEGIFLAHYSYKNLYTEFKFTYAEQGRDLSDSTNWGGDVFRSTRDREQNYGNEVGQGASFKTTTVRLFASYLLSSKSNLRAEFSVMHWSQQGPSPTQNTLWTSLGIRMALFNQYRDF